MNSQKIILACLLLSFTAHLSSAKADEQWADPDAKAIYETTPDANTGIRPLVKLLWVPLNRPATLTLLKQNIEKTSTPLNSATIQPKLQTVIAPGLGGVGVNPFALSSGDFRTGFHLTNETAYGPIPTVPFQDVKWFDEQVAANNLPDVFLIGGHHVISQGWHNDRETGFLYSPTLVDTLSKSASARKLFDHVKLAVLWGCNTMTNLEPHGSLGEFLDSVEIEKIYSSSKAGRLAMIGINSSGRVRNNSLEFYKQRLASEYGPSSPKYEYTRYASKERCTPNSSEPFKNCPVTNLERIMPESFLYDGKHEVNEPQFMKQLFRNAYLVLGYSSASPSEEQRAKILDRVLTLAAQDLNRQLLAEHSPTQNNLLYTIIADSTEKSLRMKAIEAVRKQWTIQTYNLNRSRPSGSITPALPELDRNGVFNTKVSADSPLFAPYES